MHRPHSYPALTWLNHHYLVERSIRPDSAYALRRSLAVFEVWLKRSAELADLCDENLSRWLMDLEGIYAPATLRRMRGDLLGLKRHAADSGMADWPRRVRKIRVPRKAPRGLRREAVQRLIDHCGKLPSRRDGSHVGNYLAALIGTAWYTGLRRGDLFAFDIRQLDENGVYPVTQNKTGEVVWRWIGPETIAKLQALKDRHPLAWQGSKKMLYRWFDKLKALAGIETPGYLHLLRRSAASDVERQQRGAAGPFLGHLTPGLAERNYVDRAIAYGQQIAPEQLRHCDRLPEIG